MSLFVAVLALFLQNVWSMVTVQNLDCPVHFEGKVHKILEPSAPASLFSTNKVVFGRTQMIRGEVQDQVVVDVLRNGPFEIEQGAEYRVQLRNGRICSLEKI